jgi:hypothetical protein
MMDKYDKRHGGAFDRGSADSYYRRGRNPHYFTGATYSTPKVEGHLMSADDIEAYNAGYDYNENVVMDFKSYD